MTTEDARRQMERFFRAQDGDDFALTPHFVRLLAAGEPVAADRLAAEADWRVDRVNERLDTDPSVERDDEGRIVGLGLTLRPTPHTFTFDGRTLFGWCATDVLIAPVLLGRPGVAESTCPATGQRIRAEVTPEAVLRVDPQDAVVSEIRPDHRGANVRTEVCNLGHFFSSREAAAGWLAQHPEGLVNSVAEDFEGHRQTFAEFGSTA